MAVLGFEALQRQRLLAAGHRSHCAEIGTHNRSSSSRRFTQEVAITGGFPPPRHGGCAFAKMARAHGVRCCSAGARPLFRFSSFSPCEERSSWDTSRPARCRLQDSRPAKSRYQNACRKSIQWAILDSSIPSSPTKAGVKFRAEFGGRCNWSSGFSCIGSGGEDLGELLLVAVPPAKRGRSMSLAIPTPRISLVQQRRVRADRFLRQMLRFLASVVFSRLKRKHHRAGGALESAAASKGLCSVMGYHHHWRALPSPARGLRFTAPWTTSASAARLFLLHQLRSEQLLGAVRAASQSYDSYGSVSSQAEGTGSLEKAAFLDQQQQRRLYPKREGEAFLATGYGWRVRDAVLSEMQELMRLADIQTGAFHERSAIFDDLFYKLFHAEVLSTLQYKTRQLPSDRYACLLAEMDPSQMEFSDEDVDCERSEMDMIVGTVDITSVADKDILRHLPGADDYLYLSGMAVDSKYRRRSVATLLLEACLVRAMEWNFSYLVLHAYENDWRARNLYARAGFEVVAADPEWMTNFFGRRRRVVMARRIPLNQPT